jgi:hypothetical protein
MCGRFTNKLTWDEIVRLYRLTIQPPHNLPPRYICPTDPLAVVTEREGHRDPLSNCRRTSRIRSRLRPAMMLARRLVRSQAFKRWSMRLRMPSGSPVGFGCVFRVSTTCPYHPIFADSASIQLLAGTAEANAAPQGGRRR